MELQQILSDVVSLEERGASVDIQDLNSICSVEILVPFTLHKYVVKLLVEKYHLTSRNEFFGHSEDHAMTCLHYNNVMFRLVSKANTEDVSITLFTDDTSSESQ